jgi:exodeoxyribonuclease VII small subunit
MNGMPEQPEQDRPSASFEASLEELERVVKELEGGDLPLERALELYERGVQLSESCRKQLEEAETRVEILTKRNNRIQPEPFRPEKA